MRVKSMGVIEEDQARGLVEYAKTVGVVAAITPSTNPGATPVNKPIMAVKGPNAIIIAVAPAALCTTAAAVELMRRELGKIGLLEDLVQVLPPPSASEQTDELVAAADLVVATGSQDIVRHAYRSGTPAFGE
jgi:sulfoacetaldehyde dehydrogenase